MKKIFTLLLILVTVTCFSQETWTQQSSVANNNRYGAFNFSIGNKGYVGTGADDIGPYKSDFWEFDPHLNVWTQKADFGGGIRAYGTGFSIGDKGYAGTGIVASYSWTEDMWAYDTATNAWTLVDSFPGGLRYLLASFSIGNKGYAGTGEYREGPWVSSTYFNDFWEFDPTALPGHQWTRKADVPEQGRTVARGMSIGSKGYIGFGVYYYDTRKNDLWEYDPSADTWTRKADLPAEGRYQPSLFSIGNKGYVVGGHYYSALKDFWEFDPNVPDASAWTKKDDFPGEARSYGVGMTIGNNGYVGFGTNGVVPLNDLWEYRTYQIPPSFTSCPSTQTIYSTPDSCSRVVTYNAMATGNPVPEITYSFTGATSGSGSGTGSGQIFNGGITTVTISASIASDTATCIFTVSVLDTIRPAINCPSAQNLCYQPENNYTIPELTASDNCGIQSITYAITGATVRNGNNANASGYFNPGINTISWRVVDNAGNISVCTTMVRVNSRINVTIRDTYPLLIWGNVNTIYKGFGPTCVLLIAVPSGGTPYPGLNAYRYKWSSGATSFATWVCLPSTPGSYTYTVTVTDASGCTATATKTIKVVDPRCGPKNKEITICWFGNSQSCLKPWQAWIALYYGIGGKVGPCSQLAANEISQQRNIKEAFISPQTKLTVFPNPSAYGFNVKIESEHKDQVHIRIYDAMGKVIGQLNGPANKTYTFGEQYRPGMYWVEVQQGKEKGILKIVKH